MAAAAAQIVPQGAQALAEVVAAAKVSSNKQSVLQADIPYLYQSALLGLVGLVERRMAGLADPAAAEGIRYSQIRHHLLPCLP